MTTHSLERKVHSATRLIVERLERRDLLAGDVMAHVVGQMLVIWGDAADNGVMLSYDSATQKYSVSGHDAGGSPTTINGLDTSQPANVQQSGGAKQDYVGLHGGDADFAVGSPEAIDTVIQQWLSIEMGDGDDTVTLGVAGNDAGGTAPIAQSLHVRTSLRVDLGAGNDHLSIANTDVGLLLRIAAGNGDDHVDFDTEFTPTGATAPTLFPVTVRGGATISLGGGGDELTLKNASFQGDLTVLDGAGAANIQLSNVNAKNTISINTADDGDQIDIQRVRAKVLSINSNGGVDQVHLNNDAFTTLNIKLGAARDRLLINHTSTSLTAHLDGGAGGSALIGAANALHGLLRQHFG